MMACREGLWRCQQPKLRGHVVDLLLALVVAGVRPRAPGVELVRHVFREHKAEADALVGRGVSEEVCHSDEHFEHFRLDFDWAYTASDGIGGTGFLLEGARVRGSDIDAMCESSMVWDKVAHASGDLSGAGCQVRPLRSYMR